MRRRVQPELLDLLPPDDPIAIQSRRDLRRINAWMRNHIIMARALQRAMNGRRPEHIVDLGAGDGDFLLRVARLVSPNGAANSSPAHSAMQIATGPRRAASRRPSINAILLDRHASVDPQTLTAFATCGWQVKATVSDVFEWARTPSSAPADCIVANLFLHHFTETQLAEVLGAVAARARLFVAVEPRRSWRAWCCSHLVWALGSNAVTQHDATVSVRAGFAGRELSALWPTGGEWRLTERPTGWFSHLFVAQRAQ